MSRWWKCDLQVATPAWQFNHRPGMTHDLQTEDGKRAFARDYVVAVKTAGIEVIALADHNTGAWVDVMIEAGRAEGVTVFPGVEVTTSSGADGVHVIIVGDITKTSRDIDLLLSGAVGFDEDTHPRYHTVSGNQQPGSSGKTILQILDDLPDAYLAIAPHVLTDNGLASSSTAKGDIRWKAFHHERLVAVDPGDCAAPEAVSFNQKFRTRSLDHFPRLKDIAFVATSDAYCLDDIGKRFCWIRMESPSLEGLRQAFLDHDARILCDWDPRLGAFPERNPNNVRHGWVQELTLDGFLDNATSSLALTFHPALNVIIGGRGSGKSTVVAALRQLYAGYETLPTAIRDETKTFAERAFANATIRATHVLAGSQEKESLRWDGIDGLDTTGRNADGIGATFRIRVVSQKELFARVAYDPNDPFSASRSLLAFVDESLGLLRSAKTLSGSWAREREDAAASWVSAARTYRNIRADLEQLPNVRKSIADLARQVAAFDSPEVRERRLQNQARLAERDRLEDAIAELRDLLERWEGQLSDELPSDEEPNGIEEGPEALGRVEKLRAGFLSSVTATIDATRADLEVLGIAAKESEWGQSVRSAEDDEQKFVAELASVGLDPNAYRGLKEALAHATALERTLARQESELQRAKDSFESTWLQLLNLVSDRLSQREQLLTGVASRSGKLRFQVGAMRDTGSWCRDLRELLNLRADGFIEDVKELAAWLWGPLDEGTRHLRLRNWRDALLLGDFSPIVAQGDLGMRPAWRKRLEELDEAIRLRLATQLAEDIVDMFFLREGADPQQSGSWQSITQGSPGQRTAAMLAFVLNHGTEPLVLDQPEDDLDTEWLTLLVVRELRSSRWRRQLIIVTHNANIPVNGDAERVVVLENRDGEVRLRRTSEGNEGSSLPQYHCGAIEVAVVRDDIQNIMEGGVQAFVRREQRYNNELTLVKRAMV